MSELKFSQTSSRMIVKYFRDSYGVDIQDGMEFWGYTPEDVVDFMKTEYSMKVSVDEILKAARVR